MQQQQYGTYKHGRLTYRTAEEARGAARDLGIEGVHKHQANGEVVFMPGTSHEELNRALRKRGLPETMTPSERQSGMGFDLGMGGGGGLL